MREDTIEICHLKKAYGEHVIFSNLTMELKKGAVTCLMAPSGAGKTTLLRILAGLEQADGGKIGGLEALRKSMVFQEPRLAEELTAAALGKAPHVWKRKKKLPSSCGGDGGTRPFGL